MAPVSSAAHLSKDTYPPLGNYGALEVSLSVAMAVAYARKRNTSSLTVVGMVRRTVSIRAPQKVANTENWGNTLLVPRTLLPGIHLPACS